MSEKICPDCGGEGQCEYEVAQPDYRYGGELVGKWMDCETCKGSGYIEVEYLPVDGCEECEFYGVACAECVQYGEAKQA